VRDLSWFKSSYSANGQSCVECAKLPDGGIAVRDTKDREGAILTFNQEEWTAFIAGVKAGEFE
jgi:Domain of unknown function (DUF397)